MYRIDTYKDGSTLISKGVEGGDVLARIKSDFLINDASSIPLEVAINDYDDTIGYVTAFKDTETVEVLSTNRELISSFNGKKYDIRGEGKDFKRYDYIDILLSDIPNDIRDMRLTDVYHLDATSVHCFEKDGELATLIECNDELDEIEAILSFFPFAISKRVADQEFMRLAYAYGGNDGSG